MKASLFILCLLAASTTLAQVPAFRTAPQTPPASYQQVRQQLDSHYQHVSDDGEDSELNNYNRWKWYWDNHATDAPGANPFHAASAALVNYTQNLGDYCQTSETFLSDWKAVGPMDLPQSQGLVRGIWVDPNPANGYNFMLVGSNSGGIFKSTNAGASDPTTITWKCVTENLPGVGITCILRDPTNVHHFVAGTGIDNMSYGGIGVIHSYERTLHSGV